jgi:hypothetical protein
MPTNGDYQQLLKLMAAIVRKNGGEIRLDASDLLNTDVPRGFSRRYDSKAGQLVLELIEQETSLFLTSEGEIECSPQPKQKPNALNLPLELPQQLAPSQVLVQPQVQEIPQHKVVLDDERVTYLERERRKHQALKEILEFQMPEGQTAPTRQAVHREQPLTPSSTLQNRQPVTTNLPRQYWKESAKGS